MATRAEIDARKAAIAAVKNGHNTFAGAFNTGAQALTPLAADFQPLIVALNAAAVAHNNSVPLITGAESLWNSAVPSDPIGIPPNPNPSPTNEPAIGALKGNFDYAAPTVAMGWAMDLNNPTRRVIISLQVDGVEVGWTIANQPLPAVAAAGYGDGIYGWTVNIPPLAPGAHTFTAVALGAANPLGSKIVTVAGAVTAPFPLPADQPAGDSLRARFTETQLRAMASPDQHKYFYMDRDVAVLAAQGWTKLPDARFAALKLVDQKTFPEYGDVPFIKITSDGFDHLPDPSLAPYPSETLASWQYYPPTPLDDAWLTYTFIIDPDAKDGFTETGFKLLGFESVLPPAPNDWGGFSARTWHGPPLLGADGAATYEPFATYEYRPDTGSGFGEIVPDNIPTSYAPKEGKLITIDFRMAMNTAKVPNSGLLADWNADGIREVWINDVRHRFDTNVLWRLNPAAAIQMLFMQLFHGGKILPSKPIHYWIGPVLLSKTRGGMLRTLAQQPFVDVNAPAWRKGGKPMFVPFAVPGTDLSAVMSAQQIQYSGAAPDAGPNSAGFVFLAPGGHAIPGHNNQVCGIDYMQPQPTLRVLLAKSATVADDSAYFPDGQPGDFHLWYQAWQIRAQNVAVRLSATASHPSSTGFGYTDFFDKATDKWGPTPSPIIRPYNPALYTLYVAACGQHPVTEDIYYHNQEDAQVFRAATRKWEPWANGIYWGFQGIAVDAGRNCEVFPNLEGGRELQFCHLNDATFTKSPVTGVDDLQTTAPEGGMLTHDTDNDYYWYASRINGRTDIIQARAINAKTLHCELTVDLPYSGAGPYNRFYFMPAVHAVMYVPEAGPSICIPTKVIV